MAVNTNASIRVQGPEIDALETGASDHLRESGREHLLFYLQVFWINRRLLLRSGLYAVLVSVAFAFVIPVRYQSVTSLMPPDSQSNAGLGLLAAVAGNPGRGLSELQGIAGDLLGIKTSGQLFIGILNSETVADELIKQFNLEKLYHDSKLEDARKDLAKHTDISEDRKSGIISVAVTDRNPRRAAAMAQAYVTELNVLVAALSTSSARRERIFLEGQLSKVHADLEGAEQNFGAFASKNTAIDIPAQGRAMLAAAAALQGQLIAAQAELSGLQQIYTSDNARVRAAEARVNELQKKLNDIGGGGAQGAPENGNSLYPSIRKLPLLGVTYEDLYRQMKVQEAVYEYLVQQYEAVKIQEAKEIPTVKVLDVAMVPTKISFPPRGAVVVLGTMAGISLAMIWIIGRMRWDAVGPNDPRKVLTREVVASVRAGVLRYSRNGNRAGVAENSSDSKDRPDQSDQGRMQL